MNSDDKDYLKYLQAKSKNNFWFTFVYCYTTALMAFGITKYYSNMFETIILSLILALVSTLLSSLIKAAVEAIHSPQDGKIINPIIFLITILVSTAVAFFIIRKI